MLNPKFWIPYIKKELINVGYNKINSEVVACEIFKTVKNDESITMNQLNKTISNKGRVLQWSIL